MDDLEGFHHLRVGSQRVIFEYEMIAGIRTVTCVFAGPRKWIYEVENVTKEVAIWCFYLISIAPDPIGCLGGNERVFPSLDEGESPSGIRATLNLSRF